MPPAIKLRITETAAKAIINQAEYYTHQQSEALAARWEAAVGQSIETLLSMPECGTPCHFHAEKLKALRRVPVSGFPQHLLFYQDVRETRTIRIVHVIHGARDLEAAMAAL